MDQKTFPKTDAGAGLQHFDVVIVGAGIAGVGSAYHMQTRAPGRSFVLFETKATFGGTWDTHRYPGVRSDSDLHTFGYEFKPWRGVPIASGPEILNYMGEVIEENDLARHIRYRTVVRSASWSSETGLWTLEVENLESGETYGVTTGFLWMCQGYYGHEKGHMPDWPRLADFKGPVVHPQHWPDDLDYKGKRIVVIGSGATAATLIPALAEDAGHVTMLQRSPAYFGYGRNVNELAETLRELEIPEEWTHHIVRKQILKTGALMRKRNIAQPDAVKAEILGLVRQALGDDEMVAKHFTPAYPVWKQRLAFIPNGDLFQAIKSGKASVATDHIDHFEADGVVLKSGEKLEADIVITATGFDLAVLGNIAFEVDGKPLYFAETITYRGMMFTGLPNLVWVFGYFRASWTLRADLVGEFVPRLLNHMADKQARKVTVALRPEDEGMTLGPWVDPEDFNPGYVMRSMHLMPKSGDKPEWRHTQSYWDEKDAFPAIDLDGAEFIYER